MPLVEIPTFWLLIDPEGVADGSIYGARADGSIRCATAADAWRTFTPRKRDRDKEQRKGWRIIPAEHDDFQRYFIEKEPVPSESVPTETEGKEG